MSKAELLYNEAFQAYQEDLAARLDMHIRNLHKIIALPVGTYDESQTKLVRMEVTTALIAELEIIIGLPIAYIKKEQKDVEVARKTKTFMDRFRRIFTQGDSSISK